MLDIMSTHIVFETHSISDDNDRRQAGITVSYRRVGAISPKRLALIIDMMPSPLCSHRTWVLPEKRQRLHSLMEPRRFCRMGDSDSVTTVIWNGMPAEQRHENRRSFLDTPYLGGESWRDAVARVSRFLNDLPLRWEGARVLVISHVATRWGLDHCLNDIALEDLIDADFGWQEGWEYHT